MRAHRLDLFIAMALVLSSFVCPGDPLSAAPIANMGQGVIRVTTDASGRVIKAVMVQPIHPVLDKAACDWALANWRGPANRNKNITVTVVLDSNKNPTFKPTAPARQ